jgi:hypothetical protein
VVRGGSRPSGRFTVLYGVCLVLLSLSGSGAVAFVPAFVLVSLYLALIRAKSGGPGGNHQVGVMLGFAVLAVLLTGLYCHHFPARLLPRTWLGVLSNMYAFFALAVGPGGAAAWKVAAAVVLLLLTVVVGALLRSWPSEPGDRVRAVALLGFLGSFLLVAFSIGWSRACLGPTAALAYRFAPLATPLLCGLFLASTLFRAPRTKLAYQVSLVVLVTIGFLPNLRLGLTTGRTYRDHTQKVEQQLEAGLSPREVAAGGSLVAGLKGPEEMAEKLDMLLRSGVGSFAEKHRLSVRRLADHSPPAIRR